MSSVHFEFPCMQLLASCKNDASFQICLCLRKHMAALHQTVSIVDHSVICHCMDVEQYKTRDR